MYFLNKELYFPPVENAGTEGILAFGGDLSLERLLLAYQNGIFPWFDQDQDPIIWWAPYYRMVVDVNNYKVKKSLRNIIHKNIFKVTINQDFKSVITNCRTIDRKNQDGTWLSEEMIDAYTELYKIGKVKSIEVWQNDELVGGLYGVDLGYVFCGESMFSKVPNASKVGFVYLINYLKENNYLILDCQVYNDHLASLGAFEISREMYMKILHHKTII